MTHIDHPSQIPEPYDLASFSRHGERHSRVNLRRRQMAASKGTLVFSPTDLRKTFRTGMAVRSYGDNEVIFSQGDAADDIFYVQSGTVKLTAASTRRKKAIIAFLQRGSFFGEGSLGGQSQRIYTARSIGPSNIARLRKESTIRALKRDPQFATLFVAYLLSRIIRIEEDLVDQFFNFSERRLARVLLLFGQITKESKPDYPLKVSQSTLAEMVGTTRARVSKFMKRFKEKGFVSYNGGLQINSCPDHQLPAESPHVRQ
jgi:CRP/FNR family cyclic AMP-dependent transcriptional regulator